MLYQVRLEQFEGPLDLLLNLIEKQKLDITRVSLSQVADQYIEFLRTNHAISLSNLSQFLSIASRLILLKSRALLPLLEFTEEEEEALDDLEQQLRNYQKFRDAAKVLGDNLALHQCSFTREPFQGMRASFVPPKNLSSYDLKEAFLSVLGEIEQPQKLEEETLTQIVTLEDTIIGLQETLEERLQISFRETTANIKNRVELIVFFLAILELVKRRVIGVRQEDFFGDIHIEKITSM